MRAQRRERDPKEFAAGDRLFFLRSERSRGVKNGSLGTIEKIRDGVLEVKLNATDHHSPELDGPDLNL